MPRSGIKKILIFVMNNLMSLKELIETTGKNIILRMGRCSRYHPIIEDHRRYHCPPTHTVQTAFHNHKVSTSLTMQAISEPFDLLGFYVRRRTFFRLKPLSDRNPGPGANVYDRWRGLSLQLPPPSSLSV